MYWAFAISRDFARGFAAALSREDEPLLRRARRFGHLVRVCAGEVAFASPLLLYGVRTAATYRRLPKASWGVAAVARSSNAWGAVVHRNVRYGPLKRNTCDVYVPHQLFLDVQAGAKPAKPARVVFW